MSDLIKLHFLGTGSAAPTTKRFPSCQLLEFRQKNFIIDCGEGAQIQIRRNKLKFSRIVAIFISHLHGDHCFGLPGLISSLGLLGRTADLHIYSHSNLEVLLKPWMDFFMTNIQYKVIFHGIDTKIMKLIYEDRGVEVYSLPLKHRIPCCGFLFKEKQRNSKKPIVSYAYCSDTQYKQSLIEQVKEVTLLYHETTFLESEAKIAKATGHSTTIDAARIAKEANVNKLIIGHLSARYSDDELFLKEAQTIYTKTQVAHDGLVIDLQSELE